LVVVFDEEDFFFAFFSFAASSARSSRSKASRRLDQIERVFWSQASRLSKPSGLSS
jgi:hypothetical protein